MPTQTIPIPLPDSPEATGTLTNLLMALEANGLCTVSQAVIVKTTDPHTAALVKRLVAPPKPKPTEPSNGRPKENLYTDPETGETYTKMKMVSHLRFEKFEPGKRFTHGGKGLVEVYRDGEKLKLRKAKEA